MSDKFILFNERMVEAIRERQKTQTRRAINPQPSYPYLWNKVSPNGMQLWTTNSVQGEKGETELRHCPYGGRGGRLLVRERCQIYGRWVRNGVTRTGRQRWRFSTHASHQARYAGDFVAQPKDRETLGFWNRPSIFMPKWAVRIVLEIVKVRAQRLQEISEADILAEGITVDRVAKWTKTSWADMPTLHSAWGVLWDSINAERGYGWDINPWVWAITFKLSQ